MDSGSTAFYAGSATPSSAPFNVTTAGALTASSGTIGGITINSSSLSAGGWSINSSGSLTAPSGTIGGGSMSFSSVTISGTLTLGSGGKIVDADGSEWSQTGIILKSGGSFGDTIKWVNVSTDIGSIHANSGGLVMQSATSKSIQMNDQNGAYVIISGGVVGIGTSGAVSNVTFNSTNRRAEFDGRIYPGTGSASQLTGYMDWSGSRIRFAGAGLDLYSGDATNPGNTNWSSRGFSADGGGYIKFAIGGTLYRIPTYADA